MIYINMLLYSLLFKVREYHSISGGLCGVLTYVFQTRVLQIGKELILLSQKWLTNLQAFYSSLLIVRIPQSIVCVKIKSKKRKVR